jgi:uncharacterized membrane protein
VVGPPRCFASAARCCRNGPRRACAFAGGAEAGARLASAVVIALTIAKAFLIDISTLTGVYRAPSFICLGLVLVAIGWLYQRILFRRRMPPAAAMRPGA